MRSIQAQAVLHRGIDETWRIVSRPDVWRELSETFAGWGTRFRYVADGSLGPGSEVQVTTPGGDPVMRWKVSAWTPPTGFELTSTEEERRLSPFHMLLSFKLEALDTDKTEITVSMVIIFLDKTLELASLVLPVRFIYSMRLKRAVLRLRRSLAP